MSQVDSFCIEYIVAVFKAGIYEMRVFVSRISPPLERTTACVQRNLKGILIKNHRKSLLFGHSVNLNVVVLKLIYFCFASI